MHFTTATSPFLGYKRDLSASQKPHEVVASSLIQSPGNAKNSLMDPSSWGRRLAAFLASMVEFVVWGGLSCSVFQSIEAEHMAKLWERYKRRSPKRMPSARVAFQEESRVRRFRRIRVFCRSPVLPVTSQQDKSDIFSI